MFQAFTIHDSHLTTSFNSCIHLFQIQQTISTTYFVHLAIDTRSYDSRFPRKTEILQIVDTLFSLLIMTNQSTTFNRIVNFGRMKTQG